jgi:DNA repair photolyase
MTKTNPTIAEELQIFELYSSYEEIPPAKKAWITMKAKQMGKDPNMVHAGIKARMARTSKSGKKHKTIKEKQAKKTTKKSNKKLYTTKIGTMVKRSPEFQKKGLADFSLNPGYKCFNSCFYCYTGASLRTLNYWKEINRSSYELGYAVIDPEMPDRLAAHMKRKRVKGGLIQISTTVDSWDKYCRKYNIGRRLLEAILPMDGWSVRILTKNAEVEEDFDIIKKFRDKVLVGLSITGTPDKNDVMQVLEPNASSNTERMRVLRKAHRMGLRTFGMFCPLMPSIANSPKQIDRYITFAERIGAEEVFSEAVNPRGKCLVLSQNALERSGYAKESQSVKEVRNRKARSRYTLELIKSLQRSMRKYSSIRKLRFLLYNNDLLPEHLTAVRKDEAGIKFLQ